MINIYFIIILMSLLTVLINRDTQRVIVLQPLQEVNKRRLNSINKDEYSVI
jgi:hypothetical protein